MSNPFPATQVHKTTSRLMRCGFVKRPPTWYSAVLAHPPSQLAARAYPPPLPSSETRTKRASKHLRTPRPRPQIITLEPQDSIRRRFYRDHPYELYRPMSLVETGEPISRNSGEGVVQHVVELMESGATENEAYKEACEAFHASRAREQARAKSAQDEARAYGALQGKSAWDVGFDLEKDAMATWNVVKTDANAQLSRKAALAAVTKNREMTQTAI